MNGELTDVQAGFRKGRGTRDQNANIHWIIEKAREFKKKIFICISEIINISPGNLDSCLCFIQPSKLHDVLLIEVK